MLTNRFEAALLFATRLHARQSRKGSRVPYISHLLGVTALVLEDGGDEDQAIAALLHDAVEDQGGLATLEEIRSRFGEHVADIVEGCTDAFSQPKPPWKARKETYLAHLKLAGPDVRRVSLADKLHNARTILVDLRRYGERTWWRFNGGREGSLWYYHSLLEVYRELDDSPMVAELASVIAEIEKLSLAH
jgi:(p)ppGpp synthase/HD superfamily hydrolase